MQIAISPDSLHVEFDGDRRLVDEQGSPLCYWLGEILKTWTSKSSQNQISSIPISQSNVEVCMA